MITFGLYILKAVITKIQSRQTVFLGYKIFNNKQYFVSLLQIDSNREVL